MKVITTVKEADFHKRLAINYALDLCIFNQDVSLVRVLLPKIIVIVIVTDKTGKRSGQLYFKAHQPTELFYEQYRITLQNIKTSITYLQYHLCIIIYLFHIYFILNSLYHILSFFISLFPYSYQSNYLVFIACSMYSTSLDTV